MSKLVAQKRTDYTGKTVTRWVRATEDGAPAIKAPKVTAKSQPVHVDAAMDMLFDYAEGPDGAEELRTLNGSATFYSPEFAREAMSKLPVATLRAFNDAMERTPNGGKASRFLAQEAYDHIREMSDMGQTGAAKAILAQDIRRISNSAVFVDAFVALESSPSVGYAEYRSAVEKALGMVEGRPYDGTSFGSSFETDVNYLKSTTEMQDNARDHIMAFALHDAYSSDYFSPDMVGVVSRSRENWDRLVQVAAERGFDDMGLVEDILGSSNPAMSEGVL